jgi:restriction endonuclease S subunit
MSMETTLPEGWVEINLGDFIELKYGKSLPAKARDGDGFPVYGSNGVVGYHSTPLISTVGLIVGRKGSYGEVQYSSEPFFPIDTTYYVDEFHGSPAKYWFYQLEFLPLNQLNRSTAIPGLNRDDAYAQKLPLPPLAEQRVIADQLDSLLAQVEATKTRLERIPDTLKRFRQSVLADAVSGKLTEEWREEELLGDASKEILSLKDSRADKLRKEAENGNQESKRLLKKLEKHKLKLPINRLPKGWVWTGFMDSMERVVDCHNKTAPYIDNGIPLIRTPDIRNGEIKL